MTVTNNGTSTVTYSYTDSDWKELLTAVDGREITYDAIGNPLTYGGTFSGSWQFTWKNGRQLATASRYSSNISYSYDADGMRSSKNADGAISEYVYPGGKLVEETRGSNVKLQFSYDEQGRPYSVKYYDATYYYVLNLQGDVVRIVNEQGHTEAEYVYDAWGNLEYSFDVNGIGTLNPLRYRGYYYDSETGFYYVSSRYYDPGIGRFISADDIDYLGADGSLLSYNLFAYRINNPVNRFDVNGNWSLPNWVKVTIGAVEIVGLAVATVCTGGVAAGINIATGATTVVGNAHGSTLHKLVTNLEAGKMAASGQYSQIGVNKALKTMGLNGTRRPDVIGVAKNGINKLVEVVSPRQSTNYIINKMSNMLSNNPRSVGKIVTWVRRLFK